ncbi:MAG: basic amino acid ABC transporter substrate-binding protein [Chloroflexi bacterium]|nr:basic amino acid ABC transporter substrate-binding protein [Chloroflexota bacterium]
MKGKFFLLLSIVAVLSLALASCSPAANSGTAGTGKTTIRVATEASYPPFETVNEETKELEGFDIDLMNAIAEKAGLTVEYQNTPFDSVLAGMATCQFDAAVSAITITEERAKEFAFSEPYINAGQITTVRLEETSINGPDDLNGKVIGVQLGTTGQIEAEKIQGAEIRPYDTVDLAFLDLANGQVDAVIADYPTTLVYVNQFSDKIKTTGEVFTDENYGIAVCKENTELLEKINAALAEVKSEGLLTELEQKWLASQ